MKLYDILNEIDVTIPNPEITSQPRPAAGWQQTVQRAMSRLYSTDPTHRQEARQALNRLQEVLKQHYGQDARGKPTDEETVERLAKAVQVMNRLAQFLAAPRRSGPTESAHLVEGKRKRRKKTRLQKMYGRTRRGFGGFYGGYYGGLGWGGSTDSSSGDGGGDGGGGGGGE